jgi:hypothetical protein
MLCRRRSAAAAGHYRSGFWQFCCVQSGDSTCVYPTHVEQGHVTKGMVFHDVSTIVTAIGRGPIGKGAYATFEFDDCQEYVESDTFATLN